ncbi:hypothetical protein AMST5_03877 [freshwater sediment metagenome]|uniref:Uncharacterized protein n=1 Tax=freshwater sediment metagenome TaxID=556182 RepID=A0AA48M2P4_9ZZZZ
MQNIIQRIKVFIGEKDKRKGLEDRFWSRTSRKIPSIDSFLTEANDELKASYRGQCAELFFSNKGEVINKWLHYFSIYDEVMTPYIGTGVRMLEIGVFRGGSLKLWRNFLGKDAIIFGVDVNPECAVHDSHHGKVRIGSQDDPKFLESVVAEMGGVDIVIDDGSHIASHQRISFDVLFPLLSEGGIYIIEDLHTSYWPSWEGGLRRRGTAIEFLKIKIDEMHKHYFEIGSNEEAKMTSIECIQFFDSIAVVRKRKQRPRCYTFVPSLENNGSN